MKMHRGDPARNHSFDHSHTSIHLFHSFTSYPLLVIYSANKGYVLLGRESGENQMSQQLTTINKRLSAMYTDDGDSRDSGYSDTTSRPDHDVLFSINEEICDMDEVFMHDDSNDAPDGFGVKIHTHVKITESTRVTKKPESRVINRSATLILPRKRGIARSDEADIIDVKRTRRNGLTSVDNETPPSRKFPRPLQVRSFSRVNSTSVLEIKQQEEEKEPFPDYITKYSLPIVEVKDSTMAFRRLEASTLGNLMKNLTQEEFLSRFILVDCRYPYEYHGGHIKYAVNFYEQKECDDFFFGENCSRSRIPIFYCEYSQKRGPSMATLLRSTDRCRNVDRYPNVIFNELYVLDEGYKGFYNWAKKLEMESLCTPCAYVPMNDYRFATELRRFTFHRKNFRATVGIRVLPTKRRQEKHSPPKSQARRPLFKSKSSTIDVTPISPKGEEQPLNTPNLAPKRLNFSMSSPEVGFT